MTGPTPDSDPRAVVFPPTQLHMCPCNSSKYSSCYRFKPHPEVRGAERDVGTNCNARTFLEPKSNKWLTEPPRGPLGNQDANELRQILVSGSNTGIMFSIWGSFLREKYIQMKSYNGCQRVAPGSAAPASSGNLSEMQILSPTPDLLIRTHAGVQQSVFEQVL